MAWTGTNTSALERTGIPFRTAEAVIGEQGQAAVAAAGRTWARLWGRLPLVEGKSFRELFEWRDASLLWMAEGFIHTQTAGPRCARMAETALRLLEATRPSEVEAVGLGGSEVLLLSRACIARGVLFFGPVPPGRPIPVSSPSRHTLRRTLGGLFAPTTPPALAEPTTPSGEGDRAVVLLLAGASEEVHPLRSLVEALSAELGRAIVVVPTATLGRWETRRARGAAKAAAVMLRERWKQLRGAPGLTESYSHRGVGFSDLAGNDLESIVLHRLPAAVRLLETMAELVRAARPAAVVVAGVPRDDRRALLTSCAGVPAVVLHLGSVGPEERDRADGGPQAMATVSWEPGAAPTPVVARLREAVRVSLRHA